MMISEMVKTVLKVQILSSKPSESKRKDVSLQKYEVFIDLKCVESSEKEKNLKDPSYNIYVNYDKIPRKIHKQNVEDYFILP